mmetsp:Transcript_34406/g.55660  ORF Transcript_34406/g.55660 Transcript_34406/m.55660 type:complete len:466 (+) Transcript_34406:209-1606(+)|eukprot:CAMPEP_0184662918 /NCGR_PEP_ID=MMETSP0308-20130426/45594_1 /TAXON_ID=38269 /ORGANISM="Gloeochaete witrockiana, Strain SAG 46.84" /LENGTH=465 /DNA_ID=CAMNT_0027105275 /DNA_START=105 /DNA_END=1502 /DNA_ORIENTATION=+
MSKLFVGQVPRNATEEQLFPTFAAYGNVLEVSILRDRNTGQSKGCAFVKYAVPAEAEKAIELLGGKITLPGANMPLQLSYAQEDGRGGRDMSGGSRNMPQQSGSVTISDTKLFIGTIARNANEQDLVKLFEPYGSVEEVHIMRFPEGASKGCAFVRFSRREEALAAIAGLNNIHTMPGGEGPLVVKFAENKPRQSRSDFGGGGMGMAPSAPAPAPYGRGGYGGAPAPAPAPYGRGAPPPYGRGSVPNGGRLPTAGGPGFDPSYQGYYLDNNAVAQPPPQMHMMQPQGPPSLLPGGPPPYGMSQPMNNADWAEYTAPDGRKYYFNRISQTSTWEKPQEPIANLVMPGLEGPSTSQQVQYDAMQFHMGQATMAKAGPPGANLFVFHLPNDFSDQDLVNAFSQFGTIVSARVQTERDSGRSRGYGFVSYDNPQYADAAIAAMHGAQVGGKRLKVERKKGDGPGAYRPY